MRPWFRANVVISNCYICIFSLCTAVKWLPTQIVNAGPSYEGTHAPLLLCKVEYHSDLTSFTSFSERRESFSTRKSTVSVASEKMRIGRVAPADSFRHAASFGPQGMTACRDRSSWLAALPRFALKPWSRMVSV